MIKKCSDRSIKDKLFKVTNQPSNRRTNRPINWNTNKQTDMVVHREYAQIGRYTPSLMRTIKPARHKQTYIAWKETEEEEENPIELLFILYIHVYIHKFMVCGCIYSGEGGGRSSNRSFMRKILPEVSFKSLFNKDQKLENKWSDRIMGSETWTDRHTEMMGHREVLLPIRGCDGR